MNHGIQVVTSAVWKNPNKHSKTPQQAIKDKTNQVSNDYDDLNIMEKQVGVEIPVSGGPVNSYLISVVNIPTTYSKTTVVDEIRKWLKQEGFEWWSIFYHECIKDEQDDLRGCPAWTLEDSEGSVAVPKAYPW